LARQKEVFMSSRTEVFFNRAKNTLGTVTRYFTATAQTIPTALQAAKEFGITQAKDPKIRSKVLVEAGKFGGVVGGAYFVPQAFTIYYVTRSVLFWLTEKRTKDTVEKSKRVGILCFRVSTVWYLGSPLYAVGSMGKSMALKTFEAIKGTGHYQKITSAFQKNLRG
jgi:hypothetical protein